MHSLVNCCTVWWLCNHKWRWLDNRNRCKYNSHRLSMMLFYPSLVLGGDLLYQESEVILMVAALAHQYWFQLKPQDLSNIGMWPQVNALTLSKSRLISSLWIFQQMEGYLQLPVKTSTFTYMMKIQGKKCTPWSRTLTCIPDIQIVFSLWNFTLRTPTFWLVEAGIEPFRYTTYVQGW